ncbi:MAG: hypothetical protein ACYC9O_02205, partial [Candidatus Latescibacterota bacterium]
MKGIFLSFFLYLFSLSSGQIHAQGFADSPWPMFGRDPGHAHRGVSAPPATNVMKWRFKAEGPMYPPVIGADGTIYAGSNDHYL